MFIYNCFCLRFLKERPSGPIAFVGRSVGLLFNLAGLPLFEGDEQADNHCEESHTFNKSGGNDHRRTDGAGGFGLAGDTLHCSLTDFTNTDTCANCGEACADTCSQVSYGDVQ